MDNEIVSYEDMKPLEAQSIAQAQHVLMLLFMNPQATVTDTCAQVGITERQYRYWLTRGKEAINLTRTLIDEQQKQFISEIAIAKAAIIKELIKDATNTLTKPLERAKLFEVLNEELDQLQSIYNVRPGIEETAQAFLKKGPTIKKKESRFASIEIEETDEGFKIGLNEEKDIVDGEIIDIEEE